MPQPNPKAVQMANDIARLHDELGADTPIETRHLKLKGWSDREIEKYGLDALGLFQKGKRK